MAARKAASVLPDPVGAAISVWRPALMAGQASAWAGVGAAKLSANHPATAGWNRVGAVAGDDGAESASAPVRAAKVDPDSEWRSTRFASSMTRPDKTWEWPYMAPNRALRTLGR